MEIYNNIVEKMCFYENIGKWRYIQYDNEEPKWVFTFNNDILN